MYNNFFNTKFFFIHYTTGTFGSTLYHIIHNTKQCQKYFQITNKEIFSENNTAHFQIIDPIENLHNYHEFIKWKKFNQDNKKRFLFENSNKNIDQKKMQPPIRLTHFEGLDDLKQIFKNSKHIYIFQDINYSDVLKEIIKSKLVPFYQIEFFLPPKIIKLYKNEKNYKFTDVILEKSLDELLLFFYKSQNNLNLEKDDFVFNINSFFSLQDFKENVYALLKNFSLELDDNFDLDDFYNCFYDANKKYIEKALELYKIY
jgi:hypothetical protein